MSYFRDCIMMMFFLVNFAAVRRIIRVIIIIVVVVVVMLCGSGRRHGRCFDIVRVCIVTNIYSRTLWSKGIERKLSDGMRLFFYCRNIVVGLVLRNRPSS